MTCPTCSAALADDQRYCLNCGRRVGDARETLLRALAPPAVAPVAAPADPGPRLWSAAGGGALATLLAAGLLLGLLLGGDEPRQTVVRVAAAPAPDVKVNVEGGGGAAAGTPVALESDWTGDDGWTVQLEALPKDGTTPEEVDAAKARAEQKGAEDVGALDSDDWPSLDPGEYVVYSGVHPTRARATKALRGLRKDFPDAKVIHVTADAGAKVDKDARKQSDEELEDLQTATGEEYVKKSKKLPDKVATEGKIPKKDDEKPGGGTDATVLE